MATICCAEVKDKSWPYHQYYVGETDSENRKCNKGENNWSGAKSLERYSGQFLRDTMHGVGEYYWRYINPDGDFLTYEGHFYCNQMHGHGAMSYHDGRVFNGLFFSNIRWGPGIESHVDGRQNVGLWLGNNLIRVAWKPPTYNLILDLNATNTGRACVNAHRNLMMAYSETINNRNEGIELLVKYGSKPQSAEVIWTKLYPQNLTDTKSPAFLLPLFEEKYYGSRNKNMLIEIEKVPESTQSLGDNKIYFAWNNNEVIKHMMKHAFRHENQMMANLKIANIVSESRKKLKSPAKHELDCRTLLMASYLGNTEKVVQLINNEDIHPGVTDLQGNSVLMYATCGDHAQLIHFLVEAGASINNFNDCCCTALSIALIRFLCESKSISMNEMTQALIPETTLSRTNSLLQNALEWNFETQITNKINGLTKCPSKIIRTQLSQKRIKSLMSLKDQSYKNPEISVKSLDHVFDAGNEDLIESLLINADVENKYISKVAEEYSVPGTGNPVQYLFEIKDVTTDIIGSEVEEQTKSNGKTPKKVTSKATKEPIYGKSEIANVTVIQSKDNPQLLSEVQKTNTDKYERILSTINQLLIDGANPSLVQCPQPALFMAVSSGCSKLVKQLVDYGANVNELYPNIFGYSILDIAITYPLTEENLNIVTVLLENGANTQHRLPFRSKNSVESFIPGPTLLHAVLAKTTETEIEEEIRRKLIEILLNYNCDSHLQFNGRSAIDVAMTKRLDVFNIFIEHPKVNLNVVINQSKQSILTKMFSLVYFKFLDKENRQGILTSLLLHGADPLVTCQNEEQKFDNVFVYAKKILDGCENVESKHSPVASNKHSEHKVKKNGKSNEDKGAKQKTLVTDIDEYKQALELLTGWARNLHICWLRVKIVKELIKKIIKYKHRHWNMILNNIENKKSISLWLSLQATCLETWSILQSKNNKKYFDKIVLKYLLCIVLYCCRNVNTNVKEVRISVKEKNVIESDVNSLLREYKISSFLPTEKKNWISGVLDTKSTKYNICFECALPLNDEKVLCPLCHDISFCNNACMKLNTRRIDCHPCNDNLRKLIFSISSTEINSVH